jgi:circadian clock protein KaiC
VLDTAETLFGDLSNPATLRGELRRFFRWLKDRGVTAVITGDRSDGGLTRYGTGKYVPDRVTVLAHRLTEPMSTRRLRVAKTCDSIHGTHGYPFLIDEQGIFKLLVTSLGLQHNVSAERIASGVARLDTMLGGKGHFIGNSILVPGTAASGETHLTAHFSEAPCRRGERCLSFLSEESADQLLRNMRSIGVGLQPWVKKGQLRFHAAPPPLTGQEMQRATLLKLITESKPSGVIADPI